MMAGTTIIFNLVTATFRILYFNRYIQKTVGLERNNPYMTVIVICVESLIVVFGSIYFILVFRATNESVILLQLLVHLYVKMYVQ